MEMTRGTWWPHGTNSARQCCGALGWEDEIPLGKRIFWMMEPAWKDKRERKSLTPRWPSAIVAYCAIKETDVLIERIYPCPQCTPRSRDNEHLAHWQETCVHTAHVHTHRAIGMALPTHIGSTGWWGYLRHSGPQRCWAWRAFSLSPGWQFSPSHRTLCSLQLTVQCSCQFKNFCN